MDNVDGDNNKSQEEKKYSIIGAVVAPGLESVDVVITKEIKGIGYPINIACLIL